LHAGAAGGFEAEVGVFDTRHFAGAMFSRRAASRKTSGCGLCRSVSSFVTTASNQSASPMSTASWFGGSLALPFLEWPLINK
jgi:hypothetical protein